MADPRLNLSPKEHLYLLKKDREKILFANKYRDPRTDKLVRLSYGARCVALALLDKSEETKIVFAKLARKFGISNSLICRWMKQLVDAQLFVKSGRSVKTLSES